MSESRVTAAFLATVILVGCGGGGSTLQPSSPGIRNTSHAMATAAIRISVPEKATRAHRGRGSRGRAYVSPSTAGMIITVVDGNGTNSYGYDIAYDAPGCSTSGALTCTFTLPATSGSDTFSAYLYDASQGTGNPTTLASNYRAKGNLLSEIVGLTQTIAANQANQVALTLEPVVATVIASNGPAVVSVPGNGGNAAVSPVFDGEDRDDSEIATYATASNGVYKNPIVLSVTDNGAQAVTASPSPLLNATTDAATVFYDGASATQPTSATAAPYSATIVATDSDSNDGFGGSTNYATSTASVVVAPLFTYASSYGLTTTGSTTLYGIASASPSGATYNVAKTTDSGTNDCDNFTIASVSATLTNAQVAAYTVTATGNSPSGDSCVFAISDGTGTVTNSQPFVASSGGAAPSPMPTIPFAATPDTDAFYAQPSPFPSVAPGTILATQTVTFAPSGGAPMQNKAWKIKFASTDKDDHPIAAVAVVVLPLTPAVGTQPLVIDQLAEDGLGSQCAPSHSVTGSTSDYVEQAEAPLAEEGLNQGWIVVFPDYEGPNSEFAVGPTEGRIVLDAARAALSYAPAGLNAQTPIGLYGYSGGAIGTAWAATFEHTYAPELNIVGIASGGTPADPKGIVNNIDTNQVANSAFFSLILAAVVGADRGYPNLLAPIINAKGVTAATSIENGCIGETQSGGEGPTGTLPESTNVPDPVDAPNVTAILPSITLAQPNETPVVNTFVFHSQLDELIPIAGADAMVASWCAAGAPVEYYRGESGDHIGFEATVGPLAYAYLSSRFSGVTTVTPAGTTDCNT